jgi:fructose-1-phosphate kinase PfkB-like protein
VGGDFPKEELKILEARGVMMDGVQIKENEKSFFWSGRYHLDMNTRDTLETQLNVLGTFKPVVPDSYQDCEFLMLGNLAPAVQLSVINQLKNKPKLVVLDTMNFWMDSAIADLEKVLKKVDVLLVNDAEARQLSSQYSLVSAAKAIMEMGPKYLIIKKGEHGALLFGKGDQFFSCGAYPLEDIHDPTGAGDTFAGGMAGYLAGTVKKVHFNDLRRAMIYGSVLASFCVEAFSLERLRALSMEEIAKRYETFKLMSQFEVPVE